MKYRKVVALVIISASALIGYGLFSVEPFEIPYFLKRLGRSDSPSDCGPKSLQFVLQHYGIEASIDELAKKAGTTSQGTTLLALRNTARAFGLSSDGWMVAREDLQRIHLPAIVFVDGKHFSVLASTSAEDVLLIDPDRGALRVRINDFFEVWEGHTLLFAPDGDPILPIGSSPKDTTETVSSKGGSA